MSAGIYMVVRPGSRCAARQVRVRGASCDRQ
jgi:hypothetical protein